MRYERWEARVKAKRELLAASIPFEWRLTSTPTPQGSSDISHWPRTLLSEEEITITESPPLDLLTNIHAAVWSAEDVTRAFCHRAAIAHQLVNCLTEILFEDALTTARELDKYQRDTGSLRGPLHGLPMSFMDRFRIEGAETSAGFVSWLGTKESSASESLLVRHVRQLGAVPFCKTNLPQSMMLGTTTNNIFGSTLNPFNRSISAGGAAGGEGALLAMKGSPFGWVTEIAGSARIPASFNGVYALRACNGRLPTTGIASSSALLPLCRFTAATMSWDLSILQHVARITLGCSAYQTDPEWLDMPWREIKVRDLARRRPVFAVMHHDHHIQPQPPVQRAINSAVEALKSRGYQIVGWNPPPHSPAVETLFRIIGADGASEIRHQIQISGEPPVQQLKKWFFNTDATSVMSTPDFWALCRSRLDYSAAYHSYWQSTSQLTSTGLPVDGVILPVVADAACFENKLSYFGYSAIVNYLDYSAVSFPITHVDRLKDIKRPDFSSFNIDDEKMHTAYEPDTFHGAPVGLQVMCRRTEEEVALQLAAIVVDACQKSSAQIS